LTFAAMIQILFAHAVMADEVRVLCDFEEPALPKLLEFNAGKARLIQDGPLQGKQSLEITFDPKAQYHGAYLASFRMPRDWSGYDALVLDVLNPNDGPVPGYILVADRAWEQKGRTYWNRHNGERTFPPGQTEWVIPVRGLYRGEAGSRNNDIKRNIDPDGIVRVDFGFGGKGREGRIVVDNLRLVKTAAAKDVWAFDFGPPSQSLMLGWTPISHETAYSKDRGYGWGPRGGTPWNGADRDTTFGTALTQDFCEAGGYNFHVDVPPGKYRVTVIYENGGYWGGEQARHRERRILVDVRPVWQESRPDGSAHSLYRFEDVEPIGVDIWDTYMKDELARPVTFEATAGGDGLTLRFEADQVWGSKVAAMVVHRADDAAAAKWVSDQLDQVAREFRGKAVCLDPPAAKLTPPPAWEKAGLVAWPVRIEDEVTPGSVPGELPPAPEALAISRLAVRGEIEPFCVAVRPSRDLGTCRLELEAFHGPGPIAAEIAVVRYNTSRDFGNIAYHIRPHTLRRESSVGLPADLTRELIVTALVGRSTPPGKYEGALVVRNAAGAAVLHVPLRLEVRDVTLDRRTDFLMGFFGLMPPEAIPEERRWEVLDETLQMLRAHGMNALSGGPSWRLTGWNAGQPVVDFGEMDRFFALAKRYGFDRPINGYGGERFEGLHSGYERGDAGAKVEKESGLKYDEALLRAWRAVDAHAREAGWPTIFYAMCDETRVRDRAERELEFMRLLARVSREFPETLRTSGSYSVEFDRRPDDPNDMLHWHQRFFEALDISSLNGHDATVMAEARRLGKEIHIYNQGRSRYSFGLYQWSEFVKGVRARWQWHLNVLHGYQFFDLDGREPDTAMICYGRKAIYPTIHFERCREGAEDFYLYQTLARRIQSRRAAGDRGEAIEAAESLLAGAEAKIALNQREPPDGFDADRLKAEVVAAIERLAR
jgi:hypothetical protein